MVPNTTSDATWQLSLLRPGQRFWFSFLPGADIPLQVMPWRDGASPRDLTGEGAARLLGIGAVDGHGRLSVAAAGSSLGVLVQIASFAAQHQAENPQLCRLKGLTLLDVSVTGTIHRRYSSDTLWEDLPEPVIPGSLEQAAERLSGLKAGRPFRFWLTAPGPDGQPLLQVAAIRTPADEFARGILTLRSAFPVVPIGITGTAWRTDRGLVFTTTGDIALATATLAAVRAAHPPLELLLAGAVVTRTAGGRFSSTSLSRSPDA